MLKHYFSRLKSDYEMKLINTNNQSYALYPCFEIGLSKRKLFIKPLILFWGGLNPYIYTFWVYFWNNLIGSKMLEPK